MESDLSPELFASFRPVHSRLSRLDGFLAASIVVGLITWLILLVVLTLWFDAHFRDLHLPAIVTKSRLEGTIAVSLFIALLTLPQIPFRRRMRSAIVSACELAIAQGNSELAELLLLYFEKVLRAGDTHNSPILAPFVSNRDWPQLRERYAHTIQQLRNKGQGAP